MVPIGKPRFWRCAFCWSGESVTRHLTDIGPWRVPNSGHVTIMKIENLHIDTRRKIHWFHKFYSFRSTTKNNEVIAEEPFPNSDVTRRLWTLGRLNWRSSSIHVYGCCCCCCVSLLLYSPLCSVFDGPQQTISSQPSPLHNVIMSMHFRSSSSPLTWCCTLYYFFSLHNFLLSLKHSG